MAAEKKRAINTLKSMYPIRAIVDQRYKDGLEAVKAGKPVAWSMYTWWEADPILNAMDIEPIYPENHGTVCASTGIAQSYLDRSDIEGFPNYLCGYLRSCFGYTAKMVKDLRGEIPSEAPIGGMPKPMLLVCSNIFCDARFKAFQALGRYLDAPVWVLEVPFPGVKESMMEGAYERVISFIVEQLREFITFLERLLGKKMDWDKLDEVVHVTEELCRAWHKVNELRKAIPCPMHSRDFWSAMTGCVPLAPNLKEMIGLYRNMYEEVKGRVDNHIGAVSEEKYRLLFTEIPPWFNLRFFDKLAERGWNFVIESWSYHPPIPMDMSGISNPLERMARLCYQYVSGPFQDAIKDEEHMGYSGESFIKWCREYKCDGAVYQHLYSCRAGTHHLTYLERRLMEKLKVPSLPLQGDNVDLTLFNIEEALSKAEPFEETMEHYRKVRKEAGFDW